jgi:hypothetical protein
MQTAEMTTTNKTAALKQDIQNYLEDSEEYIRRNPARAMLMGLGSGFLIAQLPLRFMIFGILKIVLLLIKPAAFIYLVSKLIDDVRNAQT